MTALRKVMHDHDQIPDARDGLTRRERIVLVCLQQAQKEMRGRSVSTVMLYGRVVEHIDMSPEELQSILSRIAGQTWLGGERKPYWPDDELEP
ncbi:MAG: hypothetical protein RLZZ385_1135 [Pseudomonadota bacterium]|jgi:hypothetical protein